MTDEGCIYLVSTPIGNLADMTIRAIETLKKSDIIYAEDTKKSRILLHHYQIHTFSDSFHSYSPDSKIETIIRQAKQGKKIAIISEAGTPGISDPAYKLVKRAIGENIPIIPIPGPTAVIPALIVSGLPTDKFLFAGFLPSKKGRRKFLMELSQVPYTIVLYESVHKLEKTLKELATALGNRYICIAREMTKVHESFYRGYLEDILRKVDHIPKKGEFVLVIAGTNFKPIE